MQAAVAAVVTAVLLMLQNEPCIFEYAY